MVLRPTTRSVTSAMEPSGKVSGPAACSTPRMTSSSAAQDGSVPAVAAATETRKKAERESTGLDGDRQPRAHGRADSGVVSSSHASELTVEAAIAALVGGRVGDFYFCHSFVLGACMPQYPNRSVLIGARPLYCELQLYMRSVTAFCSCRRYVRTCASW